MMSPTRTLRISTLRTRSPLGMLGFAGDFLSATFGLAVFFLVAGICVPFHRLAYHIDPLVMQRRTRLLA